MRNRYQYINRRWTAGFILILLLSFFSAAFAIPREGSVSGFYQQPDTDALFRRALDLAREGNRGEAREICLRILSTKPGYHDVRVYLGRLYAWDKDYDDARRELSRVLTERPDSRDARQAIVDVETWAKNYESALDHCNLGLENEPENRELLLKKTRVLIRMEDFRPAAETVSRLLILDPAHTQGLELKDRIRYATELFKLSQKYQFDALQRDNGEIRPWHLFTLEGSYQTGPGSVISRINAASRNFGSATKTGLQFEMDAYPKFAHGLYAYVNVGYSTAAIFPKYRLGAELYLNLPAGFEMSAGFRYLDFSSSVVPIYTGTFGKYYKNYWFSFRPFFTDKDTGVSVSVLFLARRYAESRDTFIGILLGYGSSPVETFYLEDIERLNSVKFGIDWKKVLSRSLIAQVNARIEWEEIAPKRYGSRIMVTVKLEERYFRKY